MLLSLFRKKAARKGEVSEVQLFTAYDLQDQGECCSPPCLDFCMRMTPGFRGCGIVFFGMNPDRGSKAEMKGKKRHHIPPKLSNLVTELKGFDWHM
ncbi:hypothetical protein CgunFtcFv8_022006 [Champsocephalus gunnari]|uniref:Uncharacterized protein n=1 Tax=Champsocephalus gunnari TaxID=52237 RepID=A0AAN8DTP6_CHAGU|nr:hypothetical protein CgunFtcFv8_022006 [Champsocephalus gunnari]